ncbi:MAG: hypothetical protein WCK67_02365 [bacterium]
MSGLNGIGGGSYNFNVNGKGLKKVNNNEVNEQPKDNVVVPQTKNVSADEVLSFLGGQGSAVINRQDNNSAEAVSNKRTIQISKYVDADAAKRIAASVLAFSGSIDNIKNGLNADDSEFKGLSDNAKTELALVAFTKEFMPE